jgi:hypothetical protein
MPWTSSVIAWSFSASRQIRKGNCWDNAKSQQQIIYYYIEMYNNNRRRHATIGYLCPNDFEIQPPDSPHDFGQTVSAIARARQLPLRQSPTTPLARGDLHGLSTVSCPKA